MLKHGAQGSNVKELQVKLMKLGYPINADGIFGPKTEEAVKQFQKETGNAVDGIVGSATSKAVEERISQGWSVASVAKQSPPAKK